MHRYGGRERGSDSLPQAPRIVMSNSDPTSSQRFLLGGSYHNLTLGLPSTERTSSPSYGSHGRLDLFVGDEEILRQSSVTDAVARELQMLRISSGIGDDASTSSGPPHGPYHRPTLESAADASSIYSPIYQSTVLNHHTVNASGSFHDLSGEINGTIGSNRNSLWHNWDSYPPRSESTVLDHHASIWSNGHIGRSASPPVPIYSSLRSLQGRIVEMACHGKSSKTLQDLIKQGLDEEEIEILFNEMIHHVAVLTTHRSANQIVQLLVEVCSEEQWHIIMSMLTKTGVAQIVGICCNQQGTRVIQKLLDNANTPLQRSAILLAIAPHVAEMAKSAYGYHVILRCLEKFPDAINEFLCMEVAKNCWTIATDKEGCRAIQKYIDFARGNQRQLLVDAITTVALYLSLNYFGNYVVQHVLKLKIPGVSACIISKFSGRFSYLSCNKHASNVVECCLRESVGDEFLIVIDELLRDPNSIEVFMDEFGNYVFTSAVEVSKERGVYSIFNIFQTIIQENARLINDHFYGKKALARLGRKKLLLPRTAAALRRC
ncbi:hypothetical protein SAY87_014944 [Trapa incisa]|uniref:PUM-HD domain-containing protein n=1 Tax=Trapa incisa TaxID=236973 RepID=A0AAN7JM03_9MYRT|nr:hypothetical protein SAY87_014944 [Trapa incisa]